jgi:hypothetical protein
MLQFGSSDVIGQVIARPPVNKYIAAVEKAMSAVVGFNERRSLC